MRSVLAIFVLLTTMSTFAQTVDGIKIISAKWGTKTVSREAGTFCDTKDVCDYKISERFIGVPGGPNKTFEISWLCHGRSSTTVTTKIPADAEGKIIKLDCSSVARVEDDNKISPVVPGSRKPIPASVDYYRKLLLTYKKNPSLVRLEAFSKTLFPMEAAPDRRVEKLLSCTKGELYSSDCEPDTFYSWGPVAKMENIKRETSRGNWGSPLNEGRTIYMNQSSIGSYCYGDVAVRFKFNTSPSKGFLNSGFSSFNEWVIHDTSRVESVSFAQPEHIDEMITEIIRRLDTSKNWSEAALYVPSLESGRSAIYSGCVPEVYDLTEEVMVRNVMATIEAYLSGKSWIHTKVCDRNCDSRDHFKTNWKTFFNPS